MGIASALSGLAVGTAFFLGVVADLLVPGSALSTALTRVLGASSIGLALWMLARIAR